MEISQVFGWNGGWRVLEQGPRRGSLRERNHVPERGRSSPHHRKPVESERDSAVRRSSRAQRIEQEAEAELGIFCADAEQRQHFPLKRGIVDSNASSSELQSIQHDVVRERTNLLGLRIEELEIVRMWRRERMMHRAQGSVLLATEQRKIRDP